MGYAPSLTVLAKDVIGQGIQQAQDRDHDRLDIATRIGLYNFALSELYTILGFSDAEAYLESAEIEPTSGDVAKHGKVTLTSSNKVDKIFGIKFYAGTTHYESFDIPLRDFLAQLRNQSALSPYDEGVVYTQINKVINFLIGDSVNTTATALRAEVYYRRVPTILIVANYETGYFDAPDRYYALVVNRIASLVESQKGITDKSLVLVKTAYEQLLVSVDPTVKAGLLKSLSLPAGEAHDIQGYINEGS